MPIVVENQPVGAIGRAGAAIGAGKAAQQEYENQLRYASMQLQARNMQMDNTARQQSLRQQADMHSDSLRSAEARQDQSQDYDAWKMQYSQAAHAQERREMFDYQFTAKQNQRINELNMGLDYIDREYAAGRMDKDQYASFRSAIQQEHLGINPRAIPRRVDPQQEEWKKQGRGMGEYWEDPKFPGRVFVRDMRGNITIEPDKQEKQAIEKEPTQADVAARLQKLKKDMTREDVMTQKLIEPTDEELLKEDARIQRLAAQARAAAKPQPAGPAPGPREDPQRLAREQPVEQTSPAQQISEFNKMASTAYASGDPYQVHVLFPKVRPEFLKDKDLRQYGGKWTPQLHQELYDFQNDKKMTTEEKRAAGTIEELMRLRRNVAGMSSDERKEYEAAIKVLQK